MHNPLGLNYSVLIDSTTSPHDSFHFFQETYHISLRIYDIHFPFESERLPSILRPIFNTFVLDVLLFHAMKK